MARRQIEKSEPSPLPAVTGPAGEHRMMVFGGTWAWVQFPDEPLPDPETISALYREAKFLVNVAINIYETAPIDGNETTDSGLKSRHSLCRDLYIYAHRLRRVLPRFRESLPDYGIELREHGGCAATTWLEVLLEIAWATMQFARGYVPYWEGESTPTPASEVRYASLYADDCILADKKGRDHADPFGKDVFNAGLLKKHLEHELRNCKVVHDAPSDGSAAHLKAVREAILNKYGNALKPIKRSAALSFLRENGIPIRTATLGQLLRDLSATGEIKYQTRKPRKTKR